MARIRESRPGEAAALEALQHRAIEGWPDREAVLAANPDALAIPRAWIDEGRVRVAEDDEGTPLGFAVTLAADIDSLYVDPRRKGGGVGRLLVEDAAQCATDEGYAAIHTTANEHAVAFYESVGFRTIGEATTRFGAGKRMRRDL